MLAYFEGERPTPDTKVLRFDNVLDGHLCFMLVAKQLGAPIAVRNVLNQEGQLEVTQLELDRDLSERLYEAWNTLWMNNRTAHAVYFASVGGPLELKRQINYDEPDNEDGEESQAFDKSRRVGRDTLARCFVSAWDRVSENPTLVRSYLMSDGDIANDYSNLRFVGVQPLEPEIATIMVHQAVRESGIEIPLANGS